MTWRPGARERRALAPLVLASATAQGLLVILGPSMGAVAADLDVAVGRVGQARTVTAAVALLTSLVLLRMVARVGIRRIAVGGATAALISALVVPAAVGLPSYLLAHVVVGFAVAALLTTAFAGLAAFGDGGRAWAAGWVTAAGGAGWVVGSPVGGILTEQASWRATHALPAVLAVAALALARRCQGPVTSGYAVNLTSGPNLLASGGARTWAVAETLANVGWTSVLTYAGALLVVGLQVPEALTGWLLSAGAGCFVVASFVGGRLAASADPRGTVTVTTALLAVAVLLLFATPLIGPGGVATACGATGFALSATLAGLRIPSTSVLGMAQCPDHPQSMMATRTASMQAGYLAGAGLSGAVVDAAGWAALGPVLALVLTASALLTTRLARPGPAPTTTGAAHAVPVITAGGHR